MDGLTSVRIWITQSGLGRFKVKEEDSTLELGGGCKEEIWKFRGGTGVNMIKIHCTYMWITQIVSKNIFFLILRMEKMSQEMQGFSHVVKP